MKTRRAQILAGLVLIFMLVGCASANNNPVATVLTEPKPEYIKITPAQASEMMTGDVIILDVRTQEEFSEGHINNAVLLPDFEVAATAETLLPDKSKTILVYCRSGRRSAAAAKELILLGYTAVYDFGGIIDWQGEVIK